MLFTWKCQGKIQPWHNFLRWLVSTKVTIYHLQDFRSSFLCPFVPSGLAGEGVNGVDVAKHDAPKLQKGFLDAAPKEKKPKQPPVGKGSKKMVALIGKKKTGMTGKAVDIPGMQTKPFVQPRYLNMI